MSKKTVIQIFLTTILIIISFMIFNFFYISKENNQNLENKNEFNKNAELNKTDKNIIKDIEYSLNNDDTKIACTNKDPNSEYTTP